MQIDNKYLMSVAVIAALEAGKEILKVYNSEDFEIEYKKDSSPLTIADRKAHEVISNLLEPSNIPILSEEGKDIKYSERKKWEYFWCVDPLDGTKEFIKRNDEFTVNIALIHKNQPIMGVIYVPVFQDLYFANLISGAWKATKITVDSLSTDKETLPDSLISKSVKLPIDNLKEKYTVVGSRSHLSVETKNYIEKLKNKFGDINIISKGSALKLCMIAEGMADIYPRFGPTMEWDTAAGHAIILAAKGTVTKTDEKNLLEYNKENLLNPWFICKGVV